MQRHQKVQVWIYRRTKGGISVLLLKLIAGRGSYWQPVTGKVEPAEAIPTAAVREATEETGLSFVSEPFALGLQFDFEGRFGKATETAFGLEAESMNEKVKVDPIEHVGYLWCSVADAQRYLRFDSHIRSLKLLEANVLKTFNS